MRGTEIRHPDGSSRHALGRLKHSASLPTSPLFARSPSSATKVQRFADDSRVVVNAAGNNTWSPARVECFDAEHGSYFVHLILVNKYVWAVEAQVRLAGVRSPSPVPLVGGTEQLAETAPPTELVRPKGLLHSKSAKAVFAQLPPANALTRLQLEIKALDWMVKMLTRLAMRRWLTYAQACKAKAAKTGTSFTAAAAKKVGSPERRRATIQVMRGKIIIAAAQKKDEDLAEQQRRKSVAEIEYPTHKREVNALWQAGSWNACRELLDTCINLNRDCEALHGYRSRVHSKTDKLREALEDAHSAVDLWPCADNLLLLSRCLHVNGKLLESGRRYLEMGERGGSTIGTKGQVAESYHGLLRTIRRDRSYFGGRPPVAERVLDEDAVQMTSPPEAPQLTVSGNAATSLLVKWAPEELDDPTALVSYQIQCAEEFTVFSAKTKTFDVKYGEWQPTTFKLRVEAQAKMLTEGRQRGNAPSNMNVPLRADKHGQLMTRIQELKPGTNYVLRATTTTGSGESKWSEVAVGSTGGDSVPDNLIQLPPLPWMLGAVSFVSAALASRMAYEAFVTAIANVLTPRCMGLRRAFGHYASGKRLLPLGFNHMIRDAGLLSGCTVAQQAHSEASKLIEPAQLDLMFQRIVRLQPDGAVSERRGSMRGSDQEQAAAVAAAAATAAAASVPEAVPEPPSPPAPGKSKLGLLLLAAKKKQAEENEANATAAQESAPAAPALGGKLGGLFKQATAVAKQNAGLELRQAAEAHHAKLVEMATEDMSVMDDSVEADPKFISMAPWQCIAALVEITFQCYEHLPRIEERLARGIDAILGVVLPMLEAMQAKRAELKSARVAAIFEHFSKDLQAIFRSYAAANMDAGVGDSATLDTLDLGEMTYMLKEGEMFDENLTILKLKGLFVEVNTGAEEEGVDDDADELVYDEWIDLLALVCDAKVPEHARSGEPFEFALHAFLQLRFVPTYKRLLKEKSRGLVKKTM